MPANSVFRHETVLRGAARELLGPALGPGAVAVDCTVGGGGHTEDLLGAGATVIGLDRDPAALEAARLRLGDSERLKLVHADFRNLTRVLEDHGIEQVDALIADLGVSSPQLDVAERGFSFQGDGPLDMRMDTSRGETLLEKLADVDEGTLADVLYQYGEERQSRRIARAILKARDEGTLTSTGALAACIESTVGRKGKRHPATRSFQALRIWVNDELGALDTLLEALPDIIAPGGRVGIIAFHSLEDRRVKTAFKSLTQGCICPPSFPVCTCGKVADFAFVKRGAVKGESEGDNPRARSARLRVIRRLSEDDDGR